MYLPGLVLMSSISSFTVLAGNAGVHHQDVRRGGGQRDRREVLVGVVGRLGVEARIDHEARARDQDACSRRARRLRDLRHADIAAGAGVVLDIELLLEIFRQLLRDQPRHHVGRAAGRERHDDLHRLVGIAGGARPASGRAPYRPPQRPRDQIEVSSWCFPSTCCRPSRAVRSCVDLSQLRSPRICRASLAVASSAPMSSRMRTAFSHSAALLGVNLPLLR